MRVAGKIYKCGLIHSKTPKKVDISKLPNNTDTNTNFDNNMRHELTNTGWMDGWGIWW